MTPERWQKIEQLYHSALERDADLRANYLEQDCAGDNALRSEVETLLAQDSRAQFLESPVAGVAGKLVAGQLRSSSLIGQQLGSYKILSLLGGSALSRPGWQMA